MKWIALIFSVSSGYSIRNATHDLVCQYPEFYWMIVWFLIFVILYCEDHIIEKLDEIKNQKAR